MRTVCITLALALLAGCGSDSNAPKSVDGSYTLTSVGGHSLPANIYSETDYTLDVTKGSVELHENGTFTDSYDFSENDAGAITTATVPCSGTWTRLGNNIALGETVTGDCGDHGTGSWDGSNTVTITWESIGLPAVYSKH